MDDLPFTTQKNGSQWGAVVGIIIVVAVILFGGVYFFFKQNPPPQPAPAVGGQSA